MLKDLRKIAVPLAATLAACATILLMPSAARSQEQRCGTWETIKTFAAKTYGEAPLGGGLINQEQALIMLASPGGNSWTLVSLTTHGLACVLASGNDWHLAPFVNPDERQS